uniref:Putative integrase/recombinase n=1 Tax=Mammaliicoccus sciuri TaxID=1296 RepID=Q7WVC0_MAMSC|nr:putative integrase/recombinase [Mammaliicoccus sciuri]
MEPEKVVRRTGLHPVSSRYQFGPAGGGSVKHQNERDPGQTGGVLREGKTGKRRTIHLGNIYDELNAYIGTLNGTEWLFPSRKGQKPITRVQAYRQLNKAAQMVDMPDGIGTHTLRKTFGYWHYKQFLDIAELQNILNHAHPQITLRYIGITDEQIESNLKVFRL